MAVLAIHPGDLHVRAAFMGALDAPAAVEDAVEPARFVTPSVASLDVGGPLVGYPALMAGATARPERVVWRYRRTSLADRAIVARDRDDAGLTSEAFLTLAAGRLVADARGYTSATPEVALVVPQELDARVRARLAATVGIGAQRAVRVIGEDDALIAGSARADGTWLVVSLDDDAVRMRVVSSADGTGRRLASAELPGAGVPAVRRRWLTAWNEQAAALAPGAQGYDADGYEFERLWQDILEWLEAEDAEASRVLSWPLLRQSTVLTAYAHGASLLQDVARCIGGVAERAGDLCTEAQRVADGVIVVGPAVLRRLVMPDLRARVRLPADRFHEVGADAYARGAAALAAGGAGGVVADVAEAPHALGVVGLGEDGAATVRTVVQPGQALPATAQFTIVADRDAQKEVSVTLTHSQSPADAAHRHAFGPLVGSGPQRIGIVVEWRRDGSIDVRAVDRETGAPIACAERMELADGVPLVPAHRLRCS